MMRYFFWLMVLFCSVAYAEGFDLQSLQTPQSNLLTQNSGNRPILVDQAFVMTNQIVEHQVVLTWDIYGNYYLYQKQFQFQLEGAPKASIGVVDFPVAIVKEDPYFGKQNIYEHQVQLTVPIVGEVPEHAYLKVRYQGCSGNLCYPPQTQQILLSKGMGAPLPAVKLVGLGNDLSHGFGWTLLLLFGLGVLLTFTPCVLPMIPILSSIIVGQKEAVSLKRATLLSMSYVLGMAITYAIFGLVIARLGASVQGYLQQPWVLILSALLMVLLALSLFGFYRLQFPVFIQHALSKLYPDHRNTNYFTVFLMGAIATLIVSPCTSAPLVAVLGFVAQSGNMFKGALALFCLGLGMGFPLLIVGMGVGRFLPKAGRWMIWVQRLLGVLMILVAFSLVVRLMPWGSETTAHSAVVSAGQFESIQTTQQLDQALANAKTHAQPVLIDFYANWCVECHEMDARVFSKAPVQQALKPYVLLRIDVTANGDQAQALMHRFNIVGLPTLIIYNTFGDESHRESGFMDADAFVQLLKPTSQYTAP